MRPPWPAFALSLLLLTGCSVRTILVNGHVEPDEWQDARVIFEGGGYRVFRKADARYLYLAVGFSAQKHTGIDLVLAAQSGEQILLHVSTACGIKRMAPGGSWSEYEWSVKQWGCNPVGGIVEDGKMKFLEPGGFEFQIERRLLLAGPLKLRMQLKRPAVVVPEGSSAEDTAGWVKVDA